MKYHDLRKLIHSAEAQLLKAPIVRPTHWQGRNVQGKPDMETHEVLNFHGEAPLPLESLSYYQEIIGPDLPWADDHFEERVCGYPLNPGTQWAKWRLGKGADGFRDANGQFNINYMERIWPKYAGQLGYSEVPSVIPHHHTINRGIRYAYGDFNDVIDLLERVCGYPLNPGTQWAKWRLGKGADGFRDANGQFNINYMERIWPKYAGQLGYSEVPSVIPHHHTINRGIRYAYGDFNDVIDLLEREPLTRQAYLPIFFPEDTGAAHRDRTPCSLGWQFIMRDQKLHVIYFIRSCDLMNHFRNDLYFTVRKLLWVLGKLRARDAYWCDVTPGTLTIHVTSLHLFRANRPALRERVNARKNFFSRVFFHQ